MITLYERKTRYANNYCEFVADIRIPKQRIWQSANGLAQIVAHITTGM